MRELPRCVLLTVLLVSCGCIPLRFNTSPGASGIVVDAQTHAPIDGAKVAVSKLSYPPVCAEAALTNSRPPLVLTADAGHFTVPVERRLDFYVVPIDIFPRFGLLVVARDGYESALVPFWSSSNKELGEIPLKPLAK